MNTTIDQEDEESILQSSHRQWAEDWEIELQLRDERGRSAVSAIEAETEGSLDPSSPLPEQQNHYCDYRRESDADVGCISNMSNFLYTFTGTVQIEADDDRSADKHFWAMVKNFGCDIIVTNKIADDEESDAFALTLVYKGHTVAITRDSSHTGYDVGYNVYIDGEPVHQEEGSPGPAAVAAAKAFIDQLGDRK
jgi:hypothetical protein